MSISHRPSSIELKRPSLAVPLTGRGSTSPSRSSRSSPSSSHRTLSFDVSALDGRPYSPSPYRKRFSSVLFHLPGRRFTTKRGAITLGIILAFIWIEYVFFGPPRVLSDADTSGDSPWAWPQAFRDLSNMPPRLQQWLPTSQGASSPTYPGDLRERGVVLQPLISNAKSVLEPTDQSTPVPIRIHRLQIVPQPMRESLPPDLHLNRIATGPAAVSLSEHIASGPYEKTTEVYDLRMRPKRVALPHDAPSNEDMVLGITTNIARALTFVPLWSYWLSSNTPYNTGERPPLCMITLQDTPDERKREPELAEALQTAAIECQINWMSGRAGTRKRFAFLTLHAARAYRDTYPDRGTPKYVVIGDDDTMWVDWRALRRMLASHDPDHPALLASITEAQWRSEAWGAFAYGGGGIVSTRALVDLLEPMWDACYASIEGIEPAGGDSQLTICAARAMGLEAKAGIHGIPREAITFEDGLRQADLTVNCAGFYQAGLQFLTLHHFASAPYCRPFLDDWDPMQSMRVTLEAARLVGGDMLFYRELFDAGRQLLVLGHSLTIYDTPLTVEDMAYMERTYNEPSRFDERDPIPEKSDTTKQGKKTYYLAAVESDPDTGRAIFDYVDSRGMVVSITLRPPKIAH